MEQNGKVVCNATLICKKECTHAYPHRKSEFCEAGCPLGYDVKCIDSGVHAPGITVMEVK